MQNIVVSAVHRIKVIECEKRNKYIDLARELKKLWDIKVTIVPIVFGALGPVNKVLVQMPEDLEITARMKTVQNTAVLRSAIILRRVLES